MTGEFFSNYWWIFPLAMLLFCIVFMRGSCCATMCGFSNRNKHDTEESAQRILDRRYAQGEIDQEEYEEKKRKLTQT